MNRNWCNQKANPALNTKAGNKGQENLQRRHWDLGHGFISISLAKMMRISKFVPFDGLKLCTPSELLHLPSFLVHAKL